MRNILLIVSFASLMAACNPNKTSSDFNCTNCMVSEGVFTPAKIRMIPTLDEGLYSSQAAWDSSFLLKNNTSEMVKQLIDDAFAGKVNCYADCDTSTKLTLEEIKLKISPPADTIMVENPENPDEFLMKLVKVDALSYKNVSSIRFMENWSFNKVTGRIEKEVVWFGIEVPRFAQDGSLKGYAIPLYFKNPKN